MICTPAQDCDKHADCPSGICFQKYGVCVVAKQCLKNRDCKRNEYCNEHSACQKGRCRKKQDCTDGYVCDLRKKRCVKATVCKHDKGMIF